MDKSEAINELAAALHAFQQEMAPVTKDSDNPFFHSKYASLTAIWETVRPLLTKHGLAVLQLGAESGHEGVVGIETVLMHTSGQWISGAFSLPLGKSDPQGAGSALTYGRRYGLSAILGVVADEDDDGEGATQSFRQLDRQPPAFTPKPAPALPVVRNLADERGQEEPTTPVPAGKATSITDMASPKQQEMLRSLSKERGLDLDFWCFSQVDLGPGELDKKTASDLITKLLSLPKTELETAEPEQAQAAAAGADMHIPVVKQQAMTGDVTAAQLKVLSKIALSYSISIQDLIDQEFEGIEDPSGLMKKQASDLISKYGGTK